MISPPTFVVGCCSFPTAGLYQGADRWDVVNSVLILVGVKSSGASSTAGKKRWRLGSTESLCTRVVWEHTATDDQIAKNDGVHRG